MIIVLFTVLTASTSAGEIKLECRVVDRAGQPIAGAVAVVRTLATPDPESGKAVANDIIAELKPSQQDGRIATELLPAGSSHVLEVKCDGYVPASSRRSHLDDTGSIQLPDVVLRRLRPVSGIVVDRHGNPLSGVTILQSGDGPQRTTAVSALDGSFRIDGVPEGLALVFAQKDGFWFTGRRAPTSDEPLKIVLNPRSKANPERCDVQRRQGIIQPSTESAAASIDDQAAQVRKAANDGNRALRNQQWQTLAALDEHRALALLTELNIPKDEQTYLVMPLVTREMERDFENGMTRLMEFESADDRITSTVYYLLESKVFSPDQRKTLLAQAVTDVRSIQDPLARVYKMSVLLKPLNEIGARDTVEQLVTESIALLDEAGEGTAVQNTLGSLAENLAPIDPERALTLLDRVAPMYSAWIATGIARHNPQKAAELLRSYDYRSVGGSRLGRWYILPRSCYRLAFADADLALSTAELIDGIVHETARFTAYKPVTLGGEGEQKNAVGDLLNQAAGVLGVSVRASANATQDPVTILFKARIHGLIAQAIAKSDPDRARTLIEDAVAAIAPVQHVIRNHGGGFIYTPSLFMASLVPAAAKNDPGLAAEICWRSLALRLPATGTDDEEARLFEIGHIQTMFAIAALDQQLAADLLHGVATRSANRTYDGQTTLWWLGDAWSGLSGADGQLLLNAICDRGVAGTTSPRSSVSSRLIMRAQSADELSKMTLLEQANIWVNSIMWLHIVAEPDE
ncbi:MAG: carboxypeptidase-like regulatory domain-containing protein [Planctomycetaceae bacterium]